jgi:hypothetical protein
VLGLLVAAIAGLFVYATLIDRRRDRRRVADRAATQTSTVATSCHHTTDPDTAVAARPGRTEETQP